METKVEVKVVTDAYGPKDGLSEEYLLEVAKGARQRANMRLMDWNYAREMYHTAWEMIRERGTRHTMAIGLASAFMVGGAYGVVEGMLREGVSSYLNGQLTGPILTLAVGVLVLWAGVLPVALDLRLKKRKVSEALEALIRQSERELEYVEKVSHWLCSVEEYWGEAEREKSRGYGSMWRAVDWAKNARHDTWTMERLRRWYALVPRDHPDSDMWLIPELTRGHMDGVTGTAFTSLREASETLQQQRDICINKESAEQGAGASWQVSGKTLPNSIIRAARGLMSNAESARVDILRLRKLRDQQDIRNQIGEVYLELFDQPGPLPELISTTVAAISSYRDRPGMAGADVMLLQRSQDALRRLGTLVTARRKAAEATEV